MNSLLQSNLDRIKTQGVELQFDSILDFGFKAWKSIFLKSTVVLLIMAAIISVLVMIMMPFLMGLSFSEMVEMVQNDPQGFSEITKDPMYALKNLALTAIIILFTAPLNVGFMKMAHNFYKGEPVSVKDGFYFFKGGYYGKLLVFSLVASLIPTAIGVGLSFLHPMLSYIGSVLTVVVSILCLFSAPLIAFGDASLSDAISTSVKIVMSKFWLIVGLVIISVLFQLIGLLACCIGILFTFSFMHTIMFGLYKDLFMQEETQEEATETSSW